MRFAKSTYLIAAIYGFLVVTPLYFLFDRIGHDAPPPITHPEFYCGFVGVALLFQVLFLVIASDPIRYRPIMLVTVLEKVIYTGPCILLYLQGRIAKNSLAPSLVDPMFGLLFVIAYVKTNPAVLSAQARGSSSR
ncbi:hypothetical protein Acid345_0017 [Candidatus Koribacter versatilis Ellin345]|uniref:Uncharacterized protein n=1 Tax=Koribacter versatilis (strain Ellin345) TaxID=204669 RepID=Q1IVS8_KORVE|nr:hypothetical protein [Candidatus Koribacter versatilis]ABF39022.1 hypothetical protein Acid345_0017 [Candidatus Koribacter versatilis Ellin345]